jgi:5,10-methylenetetrahydromethanopterin reductase
MFTPADPIGQLPVFAAGVEALGFDEIWLAEDCFAYGGIAAAAVLLERTERVTVGIGLLPVGLRNPALTAMELSTLTHLHPGRLRVAFGHGVEAWMRQVGARPRNRLTYLRDVADAVSRLSEGEELVSDAEPVLDHVRLDRPPEQPPEYLVGTTGPRGLELAANLGFGLLMPEGTGPAAVSWARRTLPDHRSLTIYVWLSIADDDHSAERALLPVAQAWGDRGLYPHLDAMAGLPGTGKITTKMLSAVAVVGSPQTCAQQIVELGEAGADTIVFMPVADDRLGSLARIRSDVMPLLAAAS